MNFRRPNTDRYNPSTGTWTQQDTLDAPLASGNANRYAHAGDDPINQYDPTGTNMFDDIGRIATVLGTIFGKGSGTTALTAAGSFKICQNAFAYVNKCDAQVRKDRRTDARYEPGYEPPCQNPVE